MNYRTTPQLGWNFDELVVDNFAGGGGASTGIEAALGRPVDIAINHDPQAISMHTVNHPGTRHYCENVWQVDPREVTQGQPVGLAWFSPDCTHHSKARGGKPVSKRVRGLAWVTTKWAGLVRPRIIMLENVEEFEDWGPLTRTNRPCKRRKGMIFDRFISQIRDLGYQVEWETMRACEYGAPTIRKRLFMVARCDKQLIEWPSISYGPSLKPYRTAADIIDWSIPCPSIFGRKKPLAEKTMARIAKGIERFVINNPEPFIVENAAPFLTEHANGSGQRVFDAQEPLRTQVASIKGGHFALCTAFLAKHFGGMTGVGIDTPFPTITTAGSQNQVVTSHLLKLRGTCRHGQPVTEPMPTVTAGGLHVGEVRAFLMKYYGTGGQWQAVNEPLHTLSTKARMGLVMVRGEPYQIVDIGMRMLTPRELYRAQGFPENYVIDREANGTPITKTQQIAKCGNSVCPPVSEALVRANMDCALSKPVRRRRSA